MQRVVADRQFTDYNIDEEGNIYNFEGHKLSYYISNSGYYRVTLFINHIRTKWSVHRLMAETYIGPIPEGYVVNHKNGNRLDNRIENIEIVSPRDNMAHASRHNLYKQGENFYRAKHTAVEIAKACALLQKGYSNKEVVERIPGISAKTVCDIKSGNSWKSISNAYLIPRHLGKLRIGNLTAQEIRFLTMRILEGLDDTTIMKIFQVKPEEFDNIRCKIKELREYLKDESSTTIENPSSDFGNVYVLGE